MMFGSILQHSVTERIDGKRGMSAGEEEEMESEKERERVGGGELF